MALLWATSVGARTYECYSAPRTWEGYHAWRMVEGRKCWYKGPRWVPLEQLQWPKAQEPEEDLPMMIPIPENSFRARWEALYQ